MSSIDLIISLAEEAVWVIGELTWHPSLMMTSAPPRPDIVIWHLGVIIEDADITLFLISRK